VPPEFEKYARILYQSMGSPTLTSENIWEVYRELLARFEQLDDAVDFIEECEIYLAMLEAQTNNEENLAPVGGDLLGGPENPATDGAYYMGGVNNGLGLGKPFQLPA
jgi:hypothetical protein